MIDHPVSKKAAAAFFQISVQALDGWITAGCPVEERDGNGRIKALSLRDLVAWRLARAEGDDVGELERERTRLTRAMADKTELEVAELRGSLIRVQAVVQHWQTKIASVRAKLLTLPSKLAATVAPPERLAIAQDQAQALVYDALADLAGDGIPPEVSERAASIERSTKPARAKRAPKENQS